MRVTGAVGSLAFVPVATSEAPLPSAVGLSPTDGLMGLMVVVWGLNYIVLKVALVEVSPVALNAFRFTVTALAFWLIARHQGIRLPPRQHWLGYAAVGLIGNTVYQFAFIEGVAHTRASNAALIMAAVPVQTAALSHARGLDRLRGRDAAGFAVSTLGIVTIILGSAGGVALGERASVIGDATVWLSTVCWSLYVVGSKPLTDRDGALPVAVWTTIVGALPLLLISAPAVLAQPWGRTTAGAYAAMAASAAFALVISNIVYFRAIKVLGPARTAVYSNFTPVVASLGAWALLGETPTLWQAAGAAGIFGGLWLTRT